MAKKDADPNELVTLEILTAACVVLKDGPTFQGNTTAQCTREVAERIVAAEPDRFRIITTPAATAPVLHPLTGPEDLTNA